VTRLGTGRGRCRPRGRGGPWIRASRWVGRVDTGSQI